MQNSSLAFVVCTRLIVVPLISISLTQLLLHSGGLPPDKPMLFVLMLEACSPPAMQLMVFCQLWYEKAEPLLGSLLVAAYFCAIPTLTTWISIILYLLK